MNEADQNVETVRRGYAAFNSADMKTLADLFDGSASWHTPGRSRIAGDHKGREAVFAQFGRYGGETGGTFKATLLQVLKSDDGRVVGIIATPRSGTASAWMSAAASSSSSRMVGSLTAGNTFTTSTLGTSSGGSFAGLVSALSPKATDPFQPSSSCTRVEGLRARLGTCARRRSSAAMWSWSWTVSVPEVRPLVMHPRPRTVPDRHNGSRRAVSWPDLEDPCRDCRAADTIRASVKAVDGGHDVGRNGW